MLNVFHTSRDNVIRSSVSVGMSSYGFALENLYPLLNRFDQQRKLQGKKFYARLRKDILSGCVMPPITLAFVNSGIASNLDLQNIESFVNNQIASGYVLDGMQRLNTLHDASHEASFNRDLPIYINIIIAERYDFLLYRMITLNNGQKPMTARHQIEMLTKGILDTENLGITIVSEKDTENAKPQGAFRQSDIAEAYTAFLSDSVHIQNSKIIESKLDEILVSKVMESGITESTVSFHDVLRIVDHLSSSTYVRDWLRLGNNLIGFAVGAKQSKDILLGIAPNIFEKATKNFETAFEAINTSKVNVGKIRRELSKEFTANIGRYIDSEVDDLMEAFFNITLTD